QRSEPAAVTARPRLLPQRSHGEAGNQRQRLPDEGGVETGIFRGFRGDPAAHVLAAEQVAENIVAVLPGILIRQAVGIIEVTLVPPAPERPFESRTALRRLGLLPHSLQQRGRQGTDQPLGIRFLDAELRRELADTFAATGPFKYVCEIHCRSLW